MRDEDKFARLTRIRVIGGKKGQNKREKDMPGRRVSVSNFLCPLFIKQEKRCLLRETHQVI